MPMRRYAFEEASAEAPFFRCWESKASCPLCEMIRQKLEAFLDFCEELYDDVEDCLESLWRSMCGCCDGGDPSLASSIATSEEELRIDAVDHKLPSWTAEERNAVDNLTTYLEKRQPLLDDDCPPDLKEHLEVSLSDQRVWGLRLLASSTSPKHRRQAAAFLLALARMMLVKGAF